MTSQPASRPPGECFDGRHEWTSGGPQQHRSGGQLLRMECAHCGVGHSILVRTTAPGTLETQLTVFPATGADTVSRTIVRWSVASWEESNRDAEAKGYEVVRVEPVVGAATVGL